MFEQKVPQPLLLYVRWTGEEIVVHSTQKKGEKLGVAEAGIQSFFLCTVCLMKVSLYVQNTKKVYLICFTCKVIWWKRKSKAVIWKHGFNLVS